MRALRMLWAAPCSLVGLLLGGVLLAAGGRARVAGNTLEIFAHADEPPPGSRAAALPWAAITFGHVVLGTSGAGLERLRAHEAVHVRQYEAWGPLFLLAYPLASLVARARGQCAYRGNVFERQAWAAHPPGDACSR